MPKCKSDEVIAYIAENFGKRLQTAKAIEECSEASTELARALLADLNGEEPNKEAIAEELADAQIMIEQMIYLYDIGGKVDKSRTYKLIRTLGLMEGENAGKR